MLGDNLEGEARELGAAHARQRHRDRGERDGKPTVILSGGETTVTVRGKGRGGRNVEYLLAQAIEANGAPADLGPRRPIPTASMAPRTSPAPSSRPTRWRAPWPRAAIPQAMLDDNDGHGFFELLGDSLITGPTRTNVNDFRAP